MCGRQADPPESAGHGCYTSKSATGRKNAWGGDDKWKGCGGEAADREADDIQRDRVVSLLAYAVPAETFAGEVEVKGEGQGQDLCLLYELLRSKDLRFHLKDPSLDHLLTSRHRLRIALGTCKGPRFMHKQNPKAPRCTET